MRDRRPPTPLLLAACLLGAAPLLRADASSAEDPAAPVELKDPLLEPTPNDPNYRAPSGLEPPPPGRAPEPGLRPGNEVGIDPTPPTPPTPPPEPAAEKRDDAREMLRQEEILLKQQTDRAGSAEWGAGDEEDDL